MSQICVIRVSEFKRVSWADISRIPPGVSSVLMEVAPLGNQKAIRRRGGGFDDGKQGTSRDKGLARSKAGS